LFFANGNEKKKKKKTAFVDSSFSREKHTQERKKRTKKMTEEEEEEQTPLPYATLIAVSEDAKNILHVDQTTKECEKYGAKKCPLIGPNVDVRFSNCVIGRILMAKDNETRAKTQVADLALDLPSGKVLFFCFSRVSRVRVFVFARRAHIVSLVIVFNAYRFFFFFSTGRFFPGGKRVLRFARGGGEFVHPWLLGFYPQLSLSL